MQSEKLTLDQFHAIVIWAKFYGRTWKSELHRSWFTGNYHSHNELCGPLQTIRNTLGPEWLVKFSLKKAQAQYEAGIWAPYNR